MPIRASVVMATYNGDKYLQEQILSILQMLGPDDEMIISDDGSVDATASIIKEYCVQDKRIKFYRNAVRGIRSNFNNAIFHSSGKYIFFSDQDDIWINNKIEKVINVFETTNADLVVHNGIITKCDFESDIDKNIEKFNVSINPIRNFIKPTLPGCCMAINRKCLMYVYPFPHEVPHDMWISIILGLRGKIGLLNEYLIYHRLHDNNCTPKKTSLYFKFKIRLNLLKNILKISLCC